MFLWAKDMRWIVINFDCDFEHEVINLFMDYSNNNFSCDGDIKADRGDVQKGSAEIFFRKVKFWKEDDEEEAPPIFVGILSNWN